MGRAEQDSNTGVGERNAGRDRWRRKKNTQKDGMRSREKESDQQRDKNRGGRDRQIVLEKDKEENERE